MTVIGFVSVSESERLRDYKGELVRMSESVLRIQLVLS